MQLVGAASGDHSLRIIQVTFNPHQIGIIFLSISSHLLLFVVLIIIVW
jgi:hypothetical protein